MQQIVHGLIGKFGDGGISHRDVRAAIGVRGIGTAGAPGAIGGRCQAWAPCSFRHLDGLHRPALQQHGVERMGRLRSEGHGRDPASASSASRKGLSSKVSRRQPSSAKVFAPIGQKGLAHRFVVLHRLSSLSSAMGALYREGAWGRNVRN